MKMWGDQDLGDVTLACEEKTVPSSQVCSIIIQSLQGNPEEQQAFSTSDLHVKNLSMNLPLCYVLKRNKYTHAMIYKS